MNYTRPHYKILRKRAEEPRRFIQVISGPRQVGKTTVIRQVLSGIKTLHLYVSADNAPQPGGLWLEQQWEAARIKLKSSRAKKAILVIDEIQKIANWSEIVKSEWDKDTMESNNILVFILGSSKLLLHIGLTESLTGRFEVVPMGHWTFTEMQSAFDVSEEEYAWYGGFPAGAELMKDEPRWKDYIRNAIIETSIAKDILMMTRVDKPALLRNLFELGCAHSGEILSFTKILGQLQDAGNTTTLSNYLHLLSEAGIISGLEKYSGAVVRQRGSSPKFQVHNPAFLSALSLAGFRKIVAEPARWGRIVESAVGSHLINHVLTEGIRVFYWREGGQEIDYVITKGESTIGIEVKSGRVKNQYGIGAFREKFKPSKTILISEDGVSWKEFLKINPADLF